MPTAQGWINPLDNPARSAITRFGQRNAVYRAGSTTAGIGSNLNLTDNISLQAGYLSGEPGDPNEGAGLFNGNYGALGQLTFRNIFNVVDLAFTYVNAYTGISTSPSGITAGVPFGLGSRFSRVDVDRPVIANSYGVEANFKILKGLQIGGWAGYSAVRAIGLGDASVWNYAGTLALPDLFGKGNLGGLIVGMQPRLTGSDSSIGDVLGSRKDPDVGIHVEAFYRWALSDNIDVTPGIVWITAPNHDQDNDDEILGVVRTTFRF
jgi:Carbohydrate-selective porin, OprB family